MIYLESERLYLREFRKGEGFLFEDLDANDNVVKYTGKTKLTAAQGEMLIAKFKTEYYSKGLGFYCCFAKDTNNYIGWFHLRKEMDTNSDVLEIGYRLKEEFWGLGYATEMSKHLILKGFETVETVSAITLPENMKSSNVMRKCNMHYDQLIDYKGFLVDRYIIKRGEQFHKSFPMNQRSYDFCYEIEPKFEGLSLETINKTIIDDPFVSLCESIVYQQISIKAGATVWKRLCNIVWPLTPENILGTNDEVIQKCGLSFRKVSYLKFLAEFYLDNTKDFEAINELSNNEVIKFLTQIKGIGPWTAEMFLMLCLARQDVSSYLDLVLRNQVQKIINIEDITESQYNQYLNKFSPYKTTASFFLWALSKKPVE